MRYFFLILLLSFLLFGCGRDAAEVGDNTAAAPALAPAAAPANPGAQRNNQELQKAPETGAERIGRDQMAPEERSGIPALTPEDAEGLSPVNRGRQNQQPTQTRDAAPQQPTAARYELDNAGKLEMVEVDKITATEVFRVSKTPCYGDCKQYSVIVYNTGLVVLNGKKNVARKGYYALMLKDYADSELLRHFREATAEGLLTVYPAGEEAPADVPATVLRYPGVDGRPQSIRVYADAPAKLQQLFDFVEALAEDGDWQLAKG